VASARLTDLSYAYPASDARALDGVTLDVGEGLTLVVGPSGGGKSTLLRVLNGLVPHFHGGRISGAALSAGVDVITTPTRMLARRVGFVFQDPELQAVYDTVEREVAFGLENLGVAAPKMAARVDDALAEAGAHHLIGRRLSTLSGGERQRVAIASVLAMKPATVVLDEPTSQLDPEGAAHVVDATMRLRESGRAVVVSEHRLEKLRGVADEVIAVEAGHAAKGDLPGDEPPTTLSRRHDPGDVAWSLHGVTAGFADCPVLHDLDLAGRHGEVVALTGANGAGKTTLLRTIAGALKPLAGKVDRAPGRIAYLPQNPAALLHRPTVRAEVELTLRRAEEAEAKDGGAAVLKALGLAHVAGRYPRDLSSGERQRAALAAVLAGRPRLVLLDEPTRGMDVFARCALTALVSLLRDGGSAIVLATHDEALVESLADRVVPVGAT
jgi:energy-coupling factor transport system ATP-binding protein